MIEKLKTVAWFATRPTFWQHAMELGVRKLRTNYDTDACARRQPTGRKNVRFPLPTRYERSAFNSTAIHPESTRP